MTNWHQFKYPLNILSALSLLCMGLLFITWPFAHTIAARNITIALGFISGSAWIWIARHKISLSDPLPHLLLLGVPCWLGILYFVFPHDVEFQRKDLTGTWTRITALIIFGYCLGKIFLAQQHYLKYFYIAIALVPLIAPLAYLWLEHEGSITPFYATFFKTKIAGAYYAMHACMMAYAFIYFLMLHKVTPPRKAYYHYAISCSLVAFAYLDFILLQSLNGIMASSIMGLLLVAALYGRLIFCSRPMPVSKIFGLFFLIIIVTSAIIFYGSKDGTGKASDLVVNISTLINVDKNKTWRRDDATRNLPDPIDSDGRTLNLSTYERVSWFIKSLQIIREYPLGIGDPYYAFGRHMRSQYPGSHVKQSHSGWLDFAMGAGIPALLLVWFANALILWRSRKVFSQHHLELARLVGVFILLGIGLMFWHSELADREFLEEYFFLMAIFGSLMVDNHKSKTST